MSEITKILEKKECSTIDLSKRKRSTRHIKMMKSLIEYKDDVKRWLSNKVFSEGSKKFKKKFVLYRTSPTNRFQLSFLMLFSLI